ncbi:MAG: protein kinase [Polyangiaceae bacterium]
MVLLRAVSGLRLGPYELGERLGAGGMAEVFVARREGPHGFMKRFAIKRILPQLLKDPRFVAMFCDEARICAALAHPNIVQVVDFGEHDGELFMAMEFVDGVSCAKLLRFVASKGQRFPLGAALFIAHEVLLALAFAHAARDEEGRNLGIVHRDVSPGNILLGRAGEVKLTDFGIVRSAFVDRRTYPGELKGKLGYMAPEQTVGGDVDARTDVFAVGIILAEMLLARPLFPGQSEMEVLTRIYEADTSVLDDAAAELPGSIVEVLRRALARAPEERYSTAEEFARAVRAVARQEKVMLSDSALLPWLSSLGVLSSQSGTRPAQVAPSQAEDIVRAAQRVAERARRSMPPPALTPATLTARYQFDGGRPLGVSEALERVATGRAGAATRVSIDGIAAVPLIEVVELRRLALRPAYRFGSPSLTSRASAVGADYLPSMLYGVVRRRRTGMLVLREDEREVRAFFRDGVPYLLSSSDANELLGRRLVAQGVISTEQLRQALEQCAAGCTRLGESLVRQGVLRGSELVRQLTDQLESRFVQLGTWRSGKLEFFDGEQSLDEVAPSSRSPWELVSAAVRNAYSSDELYAVLKICGGSPLARNPAAGVALSELGLTPAERSALGQLVGSPGLATSLEQQVLAGRMRLEDGLRAVFIGLSAGVIVAPGFRAVLLAH